MSKKYENMTTSEKLEKIEDLVIDYSYHGQIYGKTILDGDESDENVNSVFNYLINQLNWDLDGHNEDLGDFESHTLSTFFEDNILHWDHQEKFYEHFKDQIRDIKEKDKEELKDILCNEIDRLVEDGHRNIHINVNSQY